MSTIQIDLTKQVKKMKPMHAGGQPPQGGKNLNDYMHYLTEAGIPYSRLHDVGGPFGGNRFVDIPNIFRNFEADENDPASYDFTFTDLLLNNLIEANVEPYYRLGITIESQAYIKPYRTFPPKDYEKWARICEHIIRHYTEGWANGYPTRSPIGRSGTRRTAVPSRCGREHVRSCICSENGRSAEKIATNSRGVDIC